MRTKANLDLARKIKNHLQLSDESDFDVIDGTDIINVNTITRILKS